MKLRTASLLMILLCVASSALAQAPTTRPAHDAGPRAGQPRRLSEEERQSALEFARDNMPHLYTLIQSAAPDDPRRARLIGFAYRRYRASQLHRDNPEVFESTRARIHAEDELFDLVRKIQQASDDDERFAIREQLLEKVRVFVLRLMEDRQRRIETLRKQLDEEQAQLDRDREEIDRLAQRHMEMLMGNVRDAMMMPPDIRDDLHPPSTRRTDRDPRRRNDRK